MLIHVAEVRLIDGTRLHLRFDDGAAGDVDIADVLPFDGVFAPLRDPRFFAQAFADPDWGVLTWPGGLDLAPEPLWERITGRSLRPADRA
jgi:hypothetical protein